MLPSIAQLASKHGIAPLKKYGQNFIFDQSLCDRIVKAAGGVEGKFVLEIGPGPAGLTRSILSASPAKLTVIETDERCLPLLEEIKSFYPNLIIKHADALKVPLSDIISTNKLIPKPISNWTNEFKSEGAEPVKIGEHTGSQQNSFGSFEMGHSITIISNLPYNIGTPLLIAFLKQAEIIDSMTFMLQKEVVDRIVATPNNGQYGRLSVICQLLCDVQKCFDVSPKAFYPAPKIWSSIVRLTPKEIRPSLQLIEMVEKITMAAFSGRRKMIKSSLKPIFTNIEEVLDQIGINKSLRAENLSPNDYLILAKVLIG